MLSAVDVSRLAICSTFAGRSHICQNLLALFGHLVLSQLATPIRGNTKQGRDQTNAGMRESAAKTPEGRREPGRMEQWEPGSKCQILAAAAVTALEAVSDMKPAVAQRTAALVCARGAASPEPVGSLKSTCRLLNDIRPSLSSKRSSTPDSTRRSCASLASSSGP